MRVLVLGASGMLGYALFKVLSDDSQHEAWGTLRLDSGRRHFSDAEQCRLVDGIDVLDHDALVGVMASVRPDIVVNGTGLVKQLPTANNPLRVLPINALFPHRLAVVCSLKGSRLIQLSSDCVFSGRQGRYRETDHSDAEDLYGRSKFIGELHDAPHVITLRTSGIGHELNTKHGLVEWFLSQSGQVRGYTKAIYSGLPTVELARVIKDFVLPRPDLNGLYHVSARPIAKSELLKLVAHTYGKAIEILEDDSMVVDRSLNSDRFTQATGYVAPDWPELITLMRSSKEPSTSPFDQHPTPR